MLRLARTRDALSVIDDQVGAPTGAELLADITAHAARMAAARPELSGTYHAVARGETSWHGYARHVIEFARAPRRAAEVAGDASGPIPSSAYRRPRPGRRIRASTRRSFARRSVSRCRHGRQESTAC